MSRTATAVSIAVALVACPVAASASVVTFTDDAFNRADYNTMPLYASGMDVTPVFQCGLCGNPGSSLWVAGISTAEHGSSSTAFINKNFAYDPVAAGAVASISVSVDKDLSTLDRLVGFGEHVLSDDRAGWQRIHGDDSGPIADRHKHGLQYLGSIESDRRGLRGI